MKNKKEKMHCFRKHRFICWLSGCVVALAPVLVQAAEPDVFPEAMTIGEIIRTGGWLMLLLGLMSVGGLALIFYFSVVLREQVVVPPAFTTELNRHLDAGEREKARVLCRSDGSPVASVALAALDYAARVDAVDAGLVREIIEGEGSRQAAEIQNQTHYLLDLGVIAPMVGLLGTVLGMLTAFNAVALDLARAKPIYLAAGVSQALVTTAAGLLVGIPAMMAYAYFRGKTGRLIARLETVAADILTRIIQRNPS